MNPGDPNVAKVELVAQALGELREQVVFVGGCAVGLLLTDPAAAPPRVTYDVDLVAEVAALRGYHRLEREFSRRGFERDMAADAPICRWRYQRLEVDLMPPTPPCWASPTAGTRWPWPEPNACCCPAARRSG